MVEKIEKKSEKQRRGRNWATVVYPESAMHGWQEWLIDQVIPCFISPLHDQDPASDAVEGSDELKKPHWHILFVFPGNKSEQQLREIIDTIGGVGCERVQSVRAYARYLCHLDDPNKHKYPTTEVRALNGLNYMEVTNSGVDATNATMEMMDFCVEYRVNSFYILSRYAQKNRSDWFHALRTSCAVFMREWLKSKRWSDEQGLFIITDPVTGEVLFDVRDSLENTYGQDKD